MVAITTTVPVGLPGTVQTFLGGTDIRSADYNLDLMPTTFGAPVKLVNGFVSAIEEDDTAADFFGLLAASDFQNSGNANFNGFGMPAPVGTQAASVMLKGYMIVTCTVGTPVKGGAVYMRVVPDTGKAVGDLEATSDSTNSVLIPSLAWDVNGKDATTKATVIRISK